MSTPTTTAPTDHEAHIAQVTSKVEGMMQRAVAAQLMHETLEPGKYDAESLTITSEFMQLTRGEQVIAFLVAVKANALNYLAAHPEQREAMQARAEFLTHESRASRR
jgi:hypothetical protein